jgi:hypothetical protein
LFHIASICTGSNQQFPSYQSCYRDCQSWPIGFNGTKLGWANHQHSLWCRIPYVNTLITFANNGGSGNTTVDTNTMATNCSAAGGLSPQCGTECDQYCGYMQNSNAVCTTLAPTFTTAENSIDCTTLCNYWPSNTSLSSKVNSASQNCYAVQAQEATWNSNTTKCGYAKPFGLANDCIPYSLKSSSLIMMASPVVDTYCGLYNGVCGGNATDCERSLTSVSYSDINDINIRVGNTVECRYYSLLTSYTTSGPSSPATTALCLDFATGQGTSGACSWTCASYCSVWLSICVDYIDVPTYAQCMAVCSILPNNSNSSFNGPSINSVVSDTLSCRIERLLIVMSSANATTCNAASLITTIATEGLTCATYKESYCDTIIASCGVFGLGPYLDTKNMYGEYTGQYRSRDECIALATMYPRRVNYRNSSMNNNTLECRYDWADTTWTDTRQCYRAGPFSYSSCTTLNTTYHACDNHCQMIFNSPCASSSSSVSPSITSAVIASWGGSISSCIDICRYLPISMTQSINQTSLGYTIVTAGTNYGYNSTMNCRSYWSRLSTYDPLNTPLNFYDQWMLCERVQLVSYGVLRQEQCGTSCATYCQLFDSLCGVQVTQASLPWTIFNSTAQCLDACSSYPTNGYKMNAMNDTSLQCRIQQLIQASHATNYGSLGMVRMHCNAASRSPIWGCVAVDNSTSNSSIKLTTITSSNCTLYCAVMGKK